MKLLFMSVSHICYPLLLTDNARITGDFSLTLADISHQKWQSSDGMLLNTTLYPLPIHMGLQS